MDVKTMIEFLKQLPDDAQLVIREFGYTANDKENYFFLDKPIEFACYDKDHNEVGLIEAEMFKKYKDEPWFPGNEPELDEDGEGSGDVSSGPADVGMSTLDSVEGMGPVTLASRGVTGSGDVTSPEADKKKKKNRVLSFLQFNKK